jgi:hypothetical protein
LTLGSHPNESCGAAGDAISSLNLNHEIMLRVSQVMHAEARVGQSKAASGAAACRALNSMVEVAVHDTFLAVDNALELVSAYDVVVDCSDNVQTRYLVSDACVLAKPSALHAARAAVKRVQRSCIAGRCRDGPSRTNKSHLVGSDEFCLRAAGASSPGSRSSQGVRCVSRAS